VQDHEKARKGRNARSEGRRDRQSRRLATSKGRRGASLCEIPEEPTALQQGKELSRSATEVVGAGDLTVRRSNLGGRLLVFGEKRPEPAARASGVGKAALPRFQRPSTVGGGAGGKEI